MSVTEQECASPGNALKVLNGHFSTWSQHALEKRLEQQKGIIYCVKALAYAFEVIQYILRAHY